MEQIGFLMKPHGYHGLIKVIPLAGKKDKFVDLSKVYLSDGNGNSSWFNVDEIRPYTRGRFILKVNGFTKREEVEKFFRFSIAV